MNLEIETQYPIDEGSWVSVKFFRNTENRENWYSWVLTTTHLPNHTYPTKYRGMSISYNISTFKTLNNAKRNFIRYVQKFRPRLLDINHNGIRIANYIIQRIKKNNQ
jgi:hypothetical protein